jgi:hypothetical protein
MGADAEFGIGKGRKERRALGRGPNRPSHRNIPDVIFSETELIKKLDKPNNPNL